MSLNHTVTPARPRRSTLPGLALAAILAVALSGLLAGPAAAHMEVERKSPARSATTALRAVSITFSGTLRGGALRVFGPDGKKASKGKGGRDRRDASRLVARMKGGLKPGRYTVRARAVGADGHAQSWKYTITLRRG